MKILRTVGLGVLCLLPSGSAATAARRPAPTVALVYRLAGEATLTTPAEERRPLRLFDRLPAGTILEVGPGSRLALAFVNGLRYELGERSRGRLGPKGLSSRSGPVRPLPTVPPLPRLPPIAQADHPGPSAGAVRIRAERIAGLYPRRGAATLAGETILHFEPVEGGGEYRVEVQDRNGAVVFATETTSSSVNTGRSLQPGMHYDWTVRTIERVGPVATGQANFITLPSAEAKAREALRKAVEASEDGALLALLAEMDRGLGLLAEACDELRAAARKSPGDVRLAAALADLERRLSSSGQAAPVPGEPEKGAVVEDVSKGWAADRAGIRTGDLLLSWSQGNGNSGPVRSPFDLGQLEILQAPLGLVTLRGTREGESRIWVLLPGQWGMRARPTFPEALLTPYRRGLDRITTGDLEAGSEHWRTAVEVAESRKDPLRASWLQARLARELAADRRPEADAALEEAVRRLEGSQPAAVVQLLRDWNWNENLYFLRSNVGDGAEAGLRRALALAPEDSLAAAWDLSFLGFIARDRGDYAAAEDLERKANTILRERAPGSVLAWTVQRELARVAFRRGDLRSEKKILLEVLESQERLAPESLDLAITLKDLGRAFQDDLFAAEKHLQRALVLARRLSPGGPEFATVLASLGEDDILRGELAIAEERIRGALTILQKLAPESFECAYYLGRLAMLAEEKGDLAAAEQHYRYTLDIVRKLSRGVPDTSYRSIYGLWALASVERRKGNLLSADEYLQRLLETLDRISPESPDTAGICLQRASIAIEGGGNLGLAEEMYSRTLAIFEKRAPGSLFVSESLDGLGTVALGRGDLTKAKELLQSALAIRERLAPGSARVGLSLNHLGQVYRREGRLAMAGDHFCRATEMFDQQRKKLGGTTEGRLAFGGRTAEPYRDCLAALVDLGRLKEAFRVLERGRARSFLDLLTERDLSWTADLPPDLARDRKQTNTEYDRTQAALDHLSPVRDQAQIDRLLVRLRDLRARQEEIAAKIRQSSPRVAALQDPQPLNLNGARAVLDPGTVLLAWSIGRERSFLFVVQPAGTDPGLEVFSLPLGDRVLRRRVEAFRNLLQRTDSDRMALVRQARELYNALLRPAERRIAAARRLLVSPDGPLHTLPFAALVRNGRWLAEHKPIHAVLSATVYAELKKLRRQASAAPMVLAAFGDPLYPPLPPHYPSTADPAVRAAVGRGLTLTSLPSSGEEVRGIAPSIREPALFSARMPPRSGPNPLARTRATSTSLATACSTSAFR